jgi:hypothetical protein
VALNLKRASEEKTGLVRWLRPEFQNLAARSSLSNNELYTHIPRGLRANFPIIFTLHCNTTPFSLEAVPLN